MPNRLPVIEVWVGHEQMPGRIARPKRLANDGLSGRLAPRWRKGARAKILREAERKFPEIGRVSSLVGKGAWRASPNAIGLSLSDSGAYCAIAAVRGMPVGLDIEVLRPVEGESVLRDLGLTALAVQLSKLPLNVRASSFFRVWTAFEAFLKHERAEWDDGAQEFQALAKTIRLHADGNVEFGSKHNEKLNFRHIEVEPRLILCVATTRPCEVIAHNLNYA